VYKDRSAVDSKIKRTTTKQQSAAIDSLLKHTHGPFSTIKHRYCDTQPAEKTFDNSVRFGLVSRLDIKVKKGNRETQSKLTSLTPVCT
jgi:hypothetical protein